jgi:hypothetical protein
MLAIELPAVIEPGRDFFDAGDFGGCGISGAV